MGGLAHIPILIFIVNFMFDSPELFHIAMEAAEEPLLEFIEIGHFDPEFVSGIFFYIKMGLIPLIYGKSLQIERIAQKAAEQVAEEVAERTAQKMTQETRKQFLINSFGSFLFHLTAGAVGTGIYAFQALAGANTGQRFLNNQFQTNASNPSFQIEDYRDVLDFFSEVLEEFQTREKKVDSLK